MSQRRTSPSAGYINMSQMERGPNGRRLCRRCSVEVPKGRLTFCGDQCIHEHRIRTDPGYVRKCVMERDLGVCAACQLDTVALKREVMDQWAKGGRHWIHLLEGKGFDGYRSLWEADHIVPVIEGGGECGLENYRTLCQKCHKTVTRELRHRLALRRSEERTERIMQERRRTETLALPLEENLLPGS